MANLLEDTALIGRQTRFGDANKLLKKHFSTNLTMSIIHIGLVTLSVLLATRIAVALFLTIETRNDCHDVELLQHSMHSFKTIAVCV